MLTTRRTFLTTTACALATLAAPSLVWGTSAEAVSDASAAGSDTSADASGSAASASGSPSAASASDSSSAAGSSASAAGSYAVGLQEYGFTLTEVGRIEQIDATKLVFTHDATKATICFLKNSDPDRYFEIVFQTAPSDNTGKLHILEHAECAASDKYPGRDVFFYIESNCYITQTNAGTNDNATRYFVASLDEDQLATGVDFYMDCAFHSAVATDEHYFKSEAWRYELDSPDADLSLTGVVYNEMKGVYGSMEDWSYYCVSEALFPDTAQRFSSGG